MTAGSPFPPMAAAASSSSAASAPRSGEEIREAFLNFYAERGHKRMASASLIPDDPTVLLTIAGMLPFKPVFLGQQERPAPEGSRARKVACVRDGALRRAARTGSRARGCRGRGERSARGPFQGWGPERFSSPFAYSGFDAGWRTWTGGITGRYGRIGDSRVHRRAREHRGDRTRAQRSVPCTTQSRASSVRGSGRGQGRIVVRTAPARRTGHLRSDSGESALHL